MESLTNYNVVWFITVLSLPCIALFIRHKKVTSYRRLPPGPPGWPVIGNLLDLGKSPHRTLYRLRDKYGGVIWLRLGSRKAMAIVSARAAAEFFRGHDLSFADRNINEATGVNGFYERSVSLAPHGPHWRLLRRLMTVGMTATKRLDETAPVRGRCVDDMVARIEEEAERVRRTRGGARGVEVVRFVGMAIFNLVGNMVMSRDPEPEVGPRLLEAIDELAELIGRGNVADFWPWMSRFDPQGVRRLMEREIEKAIDLVSPLVTRRHEELLNGGGSEKRDFLQVMLDFRGTRNKEPSVLQDKDINIFLMEVFSGGLDPNSKTIEWSMAELLRHPESMKRVKAELNLVVGPNRKLEESDIKNLPYLQGVVKESMRLHPVLPLLIPRSAIRDNKLMGYDIPKGTQVFVDAWAIGRDPEAWDDPLTFKPERFVGSEVNYKGQHFEFIPFGAGRRMCAGMALAHRILYLVLGTLLHEFDWELDGSVTPETLDMDDKLGTTLKMVKPLVAVPKKCVSH